MLPAPKVACILQIKVQVDPKDRDTFLSLFKPIFDLVSAEPECAYFIVGEDEPGVFRWTEGYTKDKDWFMNVAISSPSQSKLTMSRCSLRNRTTRLISRPRNICSRAKVSWEILSKAR